MFDTGIIINEIQELLCTPKACPRNMSIVSVYSFGAEILSLMVGCIRFNGVKSLEGRTAPKYRLKI